VRSPDDMTAVSVVLLTQYGADRSILVFKVVTSKMNIFDCMLHLFVCSQGSTNLLRPEDIKEELCMQTRCLV